MKPFMLDNDIIKSLFSLGANDLQVPEQPVNMSLPPTYGDLNDFMANLNGPTNMSVGKPATIPQISQGIATPPEIPLPENLTKGPMQNLPKLDISTPPPVDMKKAMEQQKQLTPNPLQDAINQRNESQQLAMLLGGLNKITQGFATRGGAQIGDNQAAVQNLMKLAGQPVSDLKEKMSMDATSLKLQQEKDMADPNSSFSKMVQAQFQEIYPGVKGVEGTPASALLKIMPLAQQKLANEKYLSLQKERSSQREEDRKLRDVAGRRQLFDSANKAVMEYHPNFKDHDKSIKEFKQAKSLLKRIQEGSSTAISQLGPKLARALGEVGVLTELDVTRYMSSADYKNKFKEWASKKVRGELPQELINDLLKNANAIIVDAQGEIDQVRNDALTTARQRLRETPWQDKYTDQEIMEYLGQGKQSLIDNDKDHDTALKWAEKNPEDPRAQRILKMHGRL